MLTNMNFSEAMKMAKEKDKFLTAIDFSCTIIVMHQDGSRFEFKHASFEKLDKFWLAVFSEHNSQHVFAMPDLNCAIEIKDGKTTIIYSEGERNEVL